MCSILLSINPQHVDNILNGQKLYEFRKILCKQRVDKILMYSTSPVMKVVGEADVEDVLKGNPASIWKITKNNAGIRKKFYDQYYNHSNIAVAFKLCNVVKYDQPKDLKDFGIKYAPQSFRYI